MADEAQTDAAQLAEAPSDLPTPDNGPTLQMQDPNSGAYFDIPHHTVSQALADGLQPAWSKGESALAGASQGISLGFGDELTGAARAGAQAIGDRSLENFGEHYRQNRDDARDQLAEARQQNPGSYLGGQLAGSLPLAAGLPAGIAGAIGTGAVAGLGDSAADLTRGEVGQAIGDTAKGAAFGALAHGVIAGGKQALAAAGPALRRAAGTALLKGAGIAARDVGANSPAEASAIGQAALRQPGLVPPLLARQGATADVLAQNAGPAVEAAGRAMGAGHKAFDQLHGPTIPAARLGRDIQDAAARAVEVKPELQRHVVRAVRQISPQHFDAALAGAETPEARAALLANPSSAYNHGLTQQETQQAIGRLRDLGAHGPVPTSSEVAARKDILKPAWTQGASAIRESAETHGGPEALAAENASRQHYANMVKLQEGAEAAAKRVNSQHSSPARDLAEAGGRAAAGALVGHTPGAVLGAVGPMAARAAAPRAARALHELGSVSPQVSPAAQRLQQAFGSIFQGVTPERRQQIDMQLQEKSPRYRKMREEAASEHQVDQKK